MKGNRPGGVERFSGRPAYRQYFRVFCLFGVFILQFFFNSSPARAGDEIKLQDLIEEALRNNPSIHSSESRLAAAGFRVPQAGSLPDPMLMFGYQNEGWDRYTYGEMLMAQWMFSLSQMFPFPGKLPLREEMARLESQGSAAMRDAVALGTVEKIKSLYYELLFSYKELDLLRDKTDLFTRVEDAALSRYSAGMGPQQEVIMAQTEKYMLTERQRMLEQKVTSLEAMMNAAVGRETGSDLGRPVELPMTQYTMGMEDIVRAAVENSPEIRAQEQMVAAADAKVRMARKEYYPDFTVTGSVMKKTGPFEDMWSLSVGMNLPLFYRTKQRQAVNEAEASLSAARYDLSTMKLMLTSALRDGFSMIQASEKLMELYRTGLIPKSIQDFELALSGYVTGTVEAITVISRLKSLLDYEILYWKQFTEREKAIARMEAISGLDASVREVQGK
jgi:outer membrane protein TolC